MADSCLFCNIASGKIQSNIVYQDQSVTAFRDVNPQAPTHVLIVPNQHIESVAHIGDHDPNLVMQMLLAANRIAASEGLTTGYRIVTNVGPDAGQSVMHLHWHLLGGRKMRWPPG